MLFGMSFPLLIACGGRGSSQAASVNALPNVASPSAARTAPAAISSMAPPGTSFTAPAGTNLTVPAAPNATASGPVPVHLTYTLPNTASLQGIAHRRLQYISTSNTFISITVTPLGGSGVTTPATVCNTVTCGVSFIANPGPNTLAFTLTDGTNTLSSFSTMVIVQPSTLNTLKFTANPVVSSVTLQLASTTENAGTPINDVLTINAKDADSNTITGTSDYVDINGNPVTLLLNVQNSQSGGNGTVTIQGPSRITAPAQATVSARYDGGWLDHATISVTSTSSAVTSFTTATLMTTPYAVEYSAPNQPVSVVSGADGNLWFTEFTGAKIAKMSINGKILATYGCGTGCASPHTIVMGTDGNFWYTENTTSHLDTIIPGNTGKQIISTQALPGAVIVGPDGNLWYVAHGIGKVSTSGAAQNASAVSGHLITGITVGPDNNIWYLDSTASVIGKMNVNQSVLATYPVASVDTAFVGMVTGPGGNIWFANHASDLIEKVTPGGSITPYSLQSGAAPRNITVGPDGNIWFAEHSTNSIGEITMSGVPTEYGTANNISGTSAPIGITVGPDGNIWFAEAGSNKIAKFVL